MDGVKDIDWRAYRVAGFPEGPVRIYELKDGRVRMEAANARLIGKAVEWLNK